MAEETTTRRTRARHQIVDVESSDDEVLPVKQPRKRLKRPDDSGRSMGHRRSERARPIMNYDEYLEAMEPPKPAPELAKRRPAKAKASPVKRSRVAKKPAKTTTTTKAKAKAKAKADSSSSASSSSDSDLEFVMSGSASPNETPRGSDDDSFIVDKILGVETHTVAEWAKKCHNMHSHYITDGSIFVPDDDDPIPPATDEVEKFLVKWKDLSYLHVCWQSEKELVEYEKNAKGKIQRFLEKRAQSVLAGDEYFNPEFCTVDRVLAIQESQDIPNALEYFVKWKALGYEACTWEQAEDFHDDQAVALYHAFNRPLLRTPKVRKASNFRPYGDKIPATFKGGMELRPYQLAGLNWLLFNWYNDRNSLLADEMGLGKTVQTVSYINHLVKVEQRRGPYLIIAPLSTLAHWQREFTNWTELNAVVYHGSQAERKTIEKYEFYLPHPHDKEPGAPVANKKAPHYRFDVLITTYEMCVAADRSTLGRIPWTVVAVDEAHRLKNRKSKLSSVLLSDFTYGNLLLLTGTPLQNNVEELWTLLHFLDRNKFASQDEFTEAFGNITDVEQVENLQSELRPFLLRRMKEDVETSLAPKEETIIEVELTVLQKQYYRAIYEHNTEFLVRGNNKKANMPSLMNIVMELRKCCNHPFLILGAEAREMARVMKESPSASPEALQELLVQSCGKLILLDKLLPRLREQGHRVLVFSQFKIMLDILEDYLRLRGYPKERIDGSITGNDRQAAIDRFSDPKSKSFIMLLSTRAGGVGINLTAADTCIIYDSDWNPQNDLQAQARCHRIGQTKAVKIYRLLTAKTYEAHMFHQASMKLGLDQAVLGGIRSKGNEVAPTSKEDVENLLKFGAYEMLKDDGAEASKRFSEESVDDILKRSTTVVHDPKKDVNPNAMSSFSKATFVSSTNPNEQVALDDPEFWTKVIGLNAVEEKTAVVKTPEKRRCKGRHGTYAEENSDGELPKERRKVSKKLKLDADRDDEAFVIDDGSPSTEDDDDDDAPLATPMLQNPNALRTTAKSQPFAAALLAFGYGRWTKIRLANPTLGALSVEQVKTYATAYVAQLVTMAAETADVQLYARRYTFIVALLADLYAKAHPQDKAVRPAPLYSVAAIPMPADMHHVLHPEATTKHAVAKLQQLEVLHVLDLLVSAKLSPILSLVAVLNDLRQCPVPGSPPSPAGVLERLRLLNVVRTLSVVPFKDGPTWWAAPNDDLRLLLGLHRHGWVRGKHLVTALQSDTLLFPPQRHPGTAVAAVWPSATVLQKRAKTLLRSWGSDGRVPLFAADASVVPHVANLDVAQKLQWLALLERQTRFMTLILEYGVPDVRTCSTVQEKREKWRYFLNDPLLSLRACQPPELTVEAMSLERAARVRLNQKQCSLAEGPSLLGGTRDKWLLTAEQATHLLHRIEFFRLLRTEVLVLRPQDLHAAMTQVTATAAYQKAHLPLWWRSPDCDILLMQGVECYGLDRHVSDIWALDLFQKLSPPGAPFPSPKWVEATVHHCAKAIRKLRALQRQHEADHQRMARETRLMMAHDPHFSSDAYALQKLQKHEAAQRQAPDDRLAHEQRRLETVQAQAQRTEAEVRARVAIEKQRLEAVHRETRRLELEIARRVQSENQRLAAVQREAARVESEVWSRVQAEQARLVARTSPPPEGIVPIAPARVVTPQMPYPMARPLLVTVGKMPSLPVPPMPLPGPRPVAPPMPSPTGLQPPMVAMPSPTGPHPVMVPKEALPVVGPRPVAPPIRATTGPRSVGLPKKQPLAEAEKSALPGPKAGTIETAFASQKKRQDARLEVKAEPNRVISATVQASTAALDRRTRQRPTARSAPEIIEIDDSD
ncbi:chromodomain protein [Achlya hypogyna]|uniref:Chromodomain protein n=1 Tax=Achlya hypogyna TaxID=1202772 RepID=A0A1V9YIX9_ACHHY|nr:chromodomain protein [Achlya hypogyna]